jgi:hypothetical protein
VISIGEGGSEQGLTEIIGNSYKTIMEEYTLTTAVEDEEEGKFCQMNSKNIIEALQAKAVAIG